MLAVTGQKQRTTGKRIYHGLAVNKMLPRSKSGPVRRNEEKEQGKDSQDAREQHVGMGDFWNCHRSTFMGNIDVWIPLLDIGDNLCSPVMQHRRDNQRHAKCIASARHPHIIPLVGTEST